MRDVQKSWLTALCASGFYASKPCASRFWASGSNRRPKTQFIILIFNYSAILYDYAIFEPYNVIGFFDYVRIVGAEDKSRAKSFVHLAHKTQDAFASGRV